MNAERVTSIVFYLKYRMPDENQLMALLKKRLVDRQGRRLGAGSLYGPFRKKCLADICTLIRQEFRDMGMNVPVIPKGVRCKFEFTWFETTRKRDPDNIAAGGRKIILDAMRAIGMLSNDGWSSYVEGSPSCSDTFEFSILEDGVSVRVQCYKEEQLQEPIVHPEFK